MPRSGVKCAVLIATALLLAPIPTEAAGRCAGVLEVHGFLRWAANRCTLSAYNPALVEESP